MSLDLSKATDDIPKFSLAGHEYEAKCVSVYDGDTCHIVFEYNGALTKWTLRLLGINSPEIKDKDPEIVKKAVESRDFLRSIILDKIIKVKIEGFEKYGRLLGTITVKQGKKYVNVNKLMIDKGYAISFMHDYNDL